MNEAVGPHHFLLPMNVILSSIEVVKTNQTIEKVGGIWTSSKQCGAIIASAIIGRAAVAVGFHPIKVDVALVSPQSVAASRDLSAWRWVCPRGSHKSQEIVFLHGVLLAPAAAAVVVAASSR